MTGVPGPLLFARYAYPPCELDYCGPDAAPILLEYGAARASDPDLVRLARGFEGAWPYLELIAHSNAISDPLDGRVVEAYWIGNDLLRSAAMALLGDSLDGRFRSQAGRDWDRLASAVTAGGVPHHSFHVFAVYPWVGLMRLGHTVEPLRVLDRCRVRWGVVHSIDGDFAHVQSRALEWDGGRLVVGGTRAETVQWAAGGSAFVRSLQPGDRVSMHWDWVCDVVTPRQCSALDRYTRASLSVANRSESTGAVLG